MESKCDGNVDYRGTKCHTVDAPVTSPMITLCSCSHYKCLDGHYHPKPTEVSKFGQHFSRLIAPQTSAPFCLSPDDALLINPCLSWVTFSGPFSKSLGSIFTVHDKSRQHQFCRASCNRRRPAPICAICFAALNPRLLSPRSQI